ncbi:hypothetical protein KQX54_002420 [Cotesia glomerata]|uniref:Uncharacterized protein n=1 Tax=Cotesia glomerata TaxID=32391 RepID=A0AAV7I0Z6_COTGL|nr:hypothetical protein KQX54_002420 [Cotesia glomerata]
MFLKLSFFVLFICVLSQHTFVDANDHTISGNFFRRIGDWQHARGDAWDRKAHIWHIFDNSDEPQETLIGNLKRGFGNKSYRLADKIDGVTRLVKGIFGQVIGSIVTKSRNENKKRASHPIPSLTTPTNPQPAPTVPTGGPYFPTTFVSTSLTPSAQPPNINSMFNPENIPFPPGTTVKGEIPAPRYSIGKLVFIDNEGKSMDLTLKQVVDIGKYFDRMLKEFN